LTINFEAFFVEVDDPEFRDASLRVRHTIAIGGAVARPKRLPA
jgi:hypothetical protein